MTKLELDRINRLRTEAQRLLDDLESFQPKLIALIAAASALLILINL